MRIKNYEAAKAELNTRATGAAATEESALASSASVHADNPTSSLDQGVSGRKRGRAEAELEAAAVAVAATREGADEEVAPEPKRARADNPVHALAVTSVSTTAPAIAFIPPFVAESEARSELVRLEKSGGIGLYFSVHWTRPDGSFSASSEKWTLGFEDELSFSERVDTIRRFVYHLHWVFLDQASPGSSSVAIATSPCKAFVEVVLNPEIIESKISLIEDPRLKFILSADYGFKRIKGVIKHKLRDPKTVLCFNTSTNGEAKGGSFSALNKGFVLLMKNERETTAIEETKVLLLMVKEICDSLIGPQCKLGRYDGFPLRVVYVDSLGKEILSEIIQVPARLSASRNDASLRAQTLDRILDSFRRSTEHAREIVLAAPKTASFFVPPPPPTSSEAPSLSAASSSSETLTDDTRSSIKSFFSKCWSRINNPGGSAAVQPYFFPRSSELTAAAFASPDALLAASHNIRANAVGTTPASSLEASGGGGASPTASSSAHLRMIAASSVGEPGPGAASASEESSASDSRLAPKTA